MGKLLTRALPGLLFLLVVAVGAGSFFLLFPKPFPPPETFDGPERAVAEPMGLFADADGHEWLVLPGLEGGLTRYPVYAWERPLRGLEAQAAYEGLERVSGQPYRVEAVGIQSGNVPLAGWLFQPEGEIRGGVVILHGSGVSDRRNSYYIYLAHRLAVAGYAVLLPDKRGSGRSGGDWRNAPLDQLAQDGADWIDSLRTRLPGVERAGVVGVSQGGIIAPQSAQLAGADFAVSLSGSAVPLRDALQHEIGNDVREGGAPEFLRGILTSAFRLRAERRHPDFWKQNGGYSMLSHWKDWQGPWFIAYGREDEMDNVPVARSEAELLSIQSNGNPSVHIYDGTGHSLTGAEDKFVPEFERDLLDWLSQQP